MPDYFLSEQYPPQLEDLFVIVWWDQRGTAPSCGLDILGESMTVDQVIADRLTVTDYLRQQQFDQEKIDLLGCSWGSSIGIQAAARSRERYHAYVGTGQMV